jgi:hypothetical protein
MATKQPSNNSLIINPTTKLNKTMNKIKAVLIYPILLLVDIGIYLTLGCHWKTTRQYSNYKLLQLWKR